MRIEYKTCILLKRQKYESIEIKRLVGFMASQPLLDYSMLKPVFFWGGHFFLQVLRCF